MKTQNSLCFGGRDGWAAIKHYEQFITGGMMHIENYRSNLSSLCLHLFRLEGADQGRRGGLIKHILADGTELKSIEGRIVPPTGKTEAVYRLIAEILTSSKNSTAVEELQAMETDCFHSYSAMI